MWKGRTIGIDDTKRRKMNSSLKHYEVNMSGRQIGVFLKYDVYGTSNALAASLFFEPSVVDESDVVSEGDGQVLELFADITINLPESESLPFGTQFVDVNNYPWIDEWLIDNSIAEPAGIFVRQGHCYYPAFRFFV